jgi:antitoxin CcdA
MRMTSRTRKKAVNLSVDAQLLEAARAHGINLSAVLQHALAQQAAQRWLDENRTAIEAYNEEVRANGVWSDGWRRW